MLLLVIMVLVRIAPTDAITRFLLSDRFIATVALSGVMFVASGVSGYAQDPVDSINGGIEASRAKVQSQKELLREGTYIPPIAGKIVPIGRRWGFAPINPKALAANQIGLMQSKPSNLSSQMTAKPRPTRLGVAETGPTQKGDRHSSAVDAGMNSDSMASGSVHQVSRQQMIILSENLMLQRIVESVLKDPADDRWTISGEITEFRNQNRLRIQTAQRTNRR
ncbi:MAG: hypothetical protein AAGG48_28450 [Planctomycetota bacterium]